MKTIVHNCLSNHQQKHLTLAAWQKLFSVKIGHWEPVGKSVQNSLE
ncbi:MAG: hypothetical protein AAGI90_04625 [Chlamydiota bacterium]